MSKCEGTKCPSVLEHGVCEATRFCERSHSHDNIAPCEYWDTNKSKEIIMENTTKLAIETFIALYFAVSFKIRDAFTDMLCAKELAKWGICDWILTATGTRGFAFELKQRALEQKVHLVQGSTPKAGDHIYVSISGESHGLKSESLTRLKEQCTRLLDNGCFIVTDNRNNASRLHNRESEGSLYTFLSMKGYHVKDNEHYAVWSKANLEVDNTVRLSAGPGSSLEYLCKQSPFESKFITKRPFIRATCDKIKFMNFSAFDIEKLSILLSDKLLTNTKGETLYKPDRTKYSKTPESLKLFVKYLQKKGLNI